MKRIGNKLIADEGCYLIKGDEIAETLSASADYDFSQWSEITIEEYNKRFEQYEETIELAQGEQ